MVADSAEPEAIVEPDVSAGSEHGAGATLAPAPAAFVYALGQIQPRFPTLAVEKEFAQATGRAGTAGLTDQETLQAVLSDPADRYLVRQLCWVYVIEGLETYLLKPRDPGDLPLLVQAVRARPTPMDLDAVIGFLGPISPPEACGLVVPIVAFDQIYSFDRDTLLDAIPVPNNIAKKAADQFRATADELLGRILQDGG